MKTSAAALFLLAVTSVSPAHAVEVTGRELGWTNFTDNATRVAFPEKVFTIEDGQPERGTGRRFRSEDGEAAMSVYILENAERDSPQSFLTKRLAAKVSELEYKRSAPHFFAISTSREGQVYYNRCNFSPDLKIHCIELVYPERDTKLWDPVVTRISRSLRPLQR